MGVVSRRCPPPMTIDQGHLRRKDPLSTVTHECKGRVHPGWVNYRPIDLFPFVYCYYPLLIMSSSSLLFPLFPSFYFFVIPLLSFVSFFSYVHIMAPFSFPPFPLLPIFPPPSPPPPSPFTPLPLQSFSPKSHDSVSFLMRTISRRFQSPTSARSPDLSAKQPQPQQSPQQQQQQQQQYNGGSAKSVRVADYGPFHPSLVNRGGDVFVLEGEDEGAAGQQW